MRRFPAYLPAFGQQSVASTGIHTVWCMDAKTIGFCTMKLHNMMHIHVQCKIRLGDIIIFSLLTLYIVDEVS